MNLQQQRTLSHYRYDQMDAGKVAYDAYRDALDRKPAMPSFDELPSKERIAWFEVAIAIKERYGAIY